MSFEKVQVVQCLAGTLNNDLHTRQLAEQSLNLNLSQQHFLNYLLKLSVDPSLDSTTQLSAVLFVKNSISKYWLKRSQQAANLVENIAINDNDKLLIKSTLIDVLTAAITAGAKPALINNYTSIVLLFLNSEVNNNNAYGSELFLIIETLFGSSANVAAGLLITYEFTKFYRWSIMGFNVTVGLDLSKIDQINESIALLNKLVLHMFGPLLHHASELVEKVRAHATDLSHDLDFAAVFLILKIFKYATYNDLPEYFLDGQDNINAWFKLHLDVMGIAYPQGYQGHGSTKDMRVKCQKWSSANVIRLFLKYGGGSSAGQIDVNRYDKNAEAHLEKLKQFQQYFGQYLLPSLFEKSYIAIDQHHSKKVLLFDDCLYWLIKLFSYALNSARNFEGYLKSHISTLIEYLIFPSILIPKDSLDLFFEDGEEFFRKYYHLNLDFHRPDTAAVHFLYKLANQQFDLIIGWLFEYLNKIFLARQAHPDDLEIAISTEAALRVIGIMSYQLLTLSSSPVANQIDQMIQSYIFPELLNTLFLFLTARALETIATFNHKFSDMNILSELFQGILGLLDLGQGTSNAEADVFLVQIEALDAIRSLLNNQEVLDYLKNSINAIVSKLLLLIAEYEIDFLTLILEEFIVSFAGELKPFANELSGKLSSQFLKVSSELLEVTNGKGGSMESMVALTAAQDDKETQCIGIVNNLSVMIELMAADKLLMVRFLVNIDPCIKFVVANSMIGVLDEVMALQNLLLKSVLRITRSIQNNFDYILENFSNFGYEEYFDYFNEFIELFVIVNYNYQFHFEDQFNKQVTASDFVDEDITNELKNTLDVGFDFQITSDSRLSAVVKLALHLLNNSLMDSDLRSVNSIYNIFQDIFLSVNNSHLSGLFGFGLESLEEDVIVQSIIERVVNSFINLIYVNLEEIVLLSEEESSLDYIDYELVYLVNNFIKLLLCIFVYRPVRTIETLNNFNNIKGFLDILEKIDSTSNSQADPVPADANLRFFVVLDKLWLTLNGNNSFKKMEKLTKYGVKIEVIAGLKFVKNQELIMNMANNSQWMTIWFKKLNIKLATLVSAIPDVSNEAGTANGNSKEAKSNTIEILDEEDDSQLLLDDVEGGDDFIYNEGLRYKLLDFKQLDTLQELKGLFSNPDPDVMRYIEDKNLAATIEQAFNVGI